MSAIELLLWPFAAGVVLTLIHAWLGLHVLARGVVFVDLSLAQVAALGITVAMLAGHAPQSEAAYWWALAFALGGAMVFALARGYERRIQQEAVIGIVYVVSASLGVLALDRAPQGAEHIKQLLIGSILTVTPREIAAIAGLYAAIGMVHVVFRRPLIEVSFELARGRRVFVWDVVFYASFALVVTSSVRVAGVLLVFTYLIVPAALAGLFSMRLGPRLALAWSLGIALTTVGLAASWAWDLPTGPAIVSAFGAAAALIGVVALARRSSGRAIARGVAGVLAAAGLLLAAVPAADQPWLAAIETYAPPVQTAFLTEFERATREETLESIARAKAELTRLRALEQDVRWGRTELPPENVERLRQYLAGRSEISAGDELVLRHLSSLARERQRWWLGLPLIALGAFGVVRLSRKR
ncbi:MAG TPA: metal ABC transporter permease [Burkholderiales bacterium]|nr:metal ABC transporter permease [Burkholderiales bacterium]